jgi:hypothetical protein
MKININLNINYGQRFADFFHYVVLRNALALGIQYKSKRLDSELICLRKFGMPFGGQMIKVFFHGLYDHFLTVEFDTIAFVLVCERTDRREI